MSLAASLGLELAPGVDEGLIELGTAFTEAAHEHSDGIYYEEEKKGRKRRGEEERRGEGEEEERRRIY